MTKMSGKTEQKLEGQRATRDFSAEFKSKREQWKIMEGQHVWKKKIVVLKSMRVLKNINKKWLKPKSVRIRMYLTEFNAD